MSAWNEIVKVLQPQINANTESENKTSMYVCQISMYVSMSNATNEPSNEHKQLRCIMITMITRTTEFKYNYK